ncbi:hypothetical protein B4102_0961 [Heyndrickxia sporothermodurans]|uniref:Uncharacterized protein n=1 Tax=Heyndrickxia sporothermodurans TaxID=46224 RepID=A0A150KJW7_9BACI|nr:hypothetical protein B4102_0961 [Heyndrickxia sporothermodurans]
MEQKTTGNLTNSLKRKDLSKTFFQKNKNMSHCILNDTVIPVIIFIITNILTF